MLEFKGEILLLTGPPGSGKTTAATTLAREPGSPKVHLHADDFWRFIKHGAIEPWRPEAHAQNGVAIDVLAGAAAGYARGGYFVVLDGIVGPWFLPAFQRLDLPVHYVVLRPGLDESIERCRRRGGDTLADPGPIADLHRQFADLGAWERHAILIQGFAPEATRAAVVAAVQSGEFRLSPERS